MVSQVIYVLLLLFALLSFGHTDDQVTQLGANELKDLIASEPFVFVLFRSADNCPECSQTIDLLGLLPQPELLSTGVQKRWVQDDALAKKYGVTKFPTIIYFRYAYAALYDGLLESTDDLPEFEAWVETATDIATKDLFEDNFEHLTQASTGATTGDWFVFFFDDGCGCCMKHLPAVESAAISQRYRMNFAKVDINLNKKLADRFKITKKPTSILFRQGKMYQYEPDKYDPKSIVSFVESWYRNVKAERVPVQQTTFDVLTQSIADNLKGALNDPTRRWIVIGAALSSIFLIIFILICLFKNSNDSKNKYE